MISRLTKCVRGGTAIVYASLGVGLLSGALGIYGFMFSWLGRDELWEGVQFGGIGLLGVVASVTVAYSSRRGEGWCWLGLLMSAGYLGITVSPPFFIGVFHTYGVLALFLGVVAALNVGDARGRAKS